MKSCKTKFSNRKGFILAVSLCLGAVGALRAQSLDPRDGASVLPYREAFDAYAQRANFPGAMQVPEVKFIIVGLGGREAVLYFQNTRVYSFHYDFVVAALGWQADEATFNRQTYFSDNRKNLAGSVVAHDHFDANDRGPGIFTVEFWPTDPVAFSLIELAFERIQDAMPFAQGRLFYHPPGETQRELYAREKELFDASNVQVIQTETLFGNQRYAALNPGEAYGRLRLIEGPEAVSRRDIVVYRTLPNTLGHVAGILTAVPQTPLSHVNIKARQNRTPNAYVRDALTNATIRSLADTDVHLVVEPNGYRLEPASAEEVEAHIEKLRPKEAQFPPRDLSVQSIRSLDDIGFYDAPSVGAKAANVAELGTILPYTHVPRGFAVPFWFYHVFMEENGFYEEARRIVSDEENLRDPEKRAEILSSFRKKIRKGRVPLWMMDALDAMHRSFPLETPLRCRSSTNNEDLPGFNGAGLYDSYTHHPHEGHIAKSMRQVWASLWNNRAFDERDFYRIDHEAAAMGVLVHPNYEDEQVNGVAVTRNIYDPNWLGYYVNAQQGEDLVTNPQAESIPEEFLVADLLGEDPYEIQYIRFSNQVPVGQKLFSQDQIYQLAAWMGRIQSHFSFLYGYSWIGDFALEIEFKVTADGDLAIKQARPWIE